MTRSFWRCAMRRSGLRFHRNCWSSSSRAPRWTFGESKPREVATRPSYDTYESFDELYRYCYLVASVVGLVCIRIFGYRDPRAEKLAEETGIAFQLTNILRDVREDAERGRIYLPLEDLRRFGVTPEQLAEVRDERGLTEPVRELLHWEALRAEEYYQSGKKLLPLIDADSRPALWVLITIYHRLLLKIKGLRYNVFSARVSVPSYEKLGDSGLGYFAHSGRPRMIWHRTIGPAWIKANNGMSNNVTATVTVVGAGVAGLAASCALAGAGYDVTLLERRPYVGGRASSYEHPALHEVVDCQHVLLGCCTNLIHLLESSGAADKIRWYDELVFLEPGGRRSVFHPNGLPAPLHFSDAFLRAPMLGVADKLAIARGMSEFMSAAEQDDEISLEQWLKRTGQTPLAIRHFWEPVVLSL